MSIQCQDQRWAFQYDPHSCMPVPMDATFVPFGLAEEPLQVQVVLGQIWIISSDKQAWHKTLHHFGHVLPHRIFLFFERLPKTQEGGFPIFCRSGAPIERGSHRTDVFDLTADLLLLALYFGKPTVNAVSQSL